MSARDAPPSPALVQVRRRIPAVQEEAFRAWTDPGMVTQWFRPRGGSSPSAEMDVRVGGRYRWAMKLLGHVYYAVGEYLEVDPPNRLVFTFGWERALVRLTDSVVTVDFERHDDGTDVVITHERLGTRTLRAMHATGWRNCLRYQRHVLGGTS
jgi:glutathione S-transferase